MFYDVAIGADGFVWFLGEKGLVRFLPGGESGEATESRTIIRNILAGDTLRSAADLEIPAVAITLCYDKGYFFQEVIQGRQIEREIQWEFSSEFEKLPNIVELNIQDKKFKIGCWLYKIKLSLKLYQTA